MSKDSVKKIVQSLKGKRAKMKKLKTEPKDTKEKKLPKDVRDVLEEEFGVKLAKVRVHTGGNLKEVCREVRAKAFTVNLNLYFLKTGAAKNSDLIAHELTHVIQQQGGKMRKKTKPGMALIAK